MPLTPLEIRNKEFRKAFRGYDEEEVDDFLDEIVESYEELYKENIGLKEALDAKDSNITRYQDLEDTIKETLVVAQKTAEETKQNSAKQAEIMIKEAELKATRTVDEAKEKARSIVEEAELQARNINNQTSEIEKQLQVFKVKFKTFLESQLTLIDDKNNGLFGEIEVGKKSADFTRVNQEVAVSSMENHPNKFLEEDSENNPSTNEEPKGILNKEVLF